MPVVFRVNGIRFYVFSNEGDPREPLHIHAGRGDAEAKFWLTPDIRVADSFGFTRREQAELLQVITARRNEIVEAWYGHFGQDG